MSLLISFLGLLLCLQGSIKGSRAHWGGAAFFGLATTSFALTVVGEPLPYGWSLLVRNVSLVVLAAGLYLVLPISHRAD